MSHTPRTWTELKSRRDRAGSNDIPEHSHSFHLVPLGAKRDEPVIHSFENFQLLRKVYTNLCTLPTPMYRDWIACCQDHISQDIVGNTPQENRENHIVATAFRDFQESYETLMKDSTIDEEVRSQQIQLSLLNLLRALLYRNSNLANSILAKSTGGGD